MPTLADFFPNAYAAADDVQQAAPASMPAPDQPQDLIAALADLRAEQARSLAEHQQASEQLQQQQDRVNLRQADLGVVQHASQAILDTTIPKSARIFAFNQLARSLGQDPTGQAAREARALLLGLDPDSAQAARNGLVARMKTGAPGEMVEMARGLLRGQLDPQQIMGLIRQPNAALDPASDEAANFDPNASVLTGRANLGGDPEATAATAPPAAAATVAPAADPLAAPKDTSAGRPLLQQEADPRYTALLPGFGPEDRPTYLELRRQGFRLPPSNPSEREKWLDRLENDGLDTSTNLARIGRIRSLIEQGGAGALQMNMGGFNLPNVGSAATQITDYLDAAGRTAWDALPRGVQETLSRRVQALGGAAIENNSDAPTLRPDARARLEAELNARILSELTPLIYGIAAQESGQRGVAVSVTDFQAAERRVGLTASPGQSIAVLDALSTQLYNQYSGRFRARTGVEGQLDPTRMTPSDVTDILNNPGVPRAARERLEYRQMELQTAGNPAAAAGAPGAPPAPAAGGPNQSPVPPAAIQSRIPTPTNQSAIPAADPAAEPAAPTGQAAPVAPAAPPAQQQQGEVQRREAEAARQVQAAEAWIVEQRNIALRAEQMHLQQLRLAEMREQRAGREETRSILREQRQIAQQRADRLAATFAQIGQMLAGAIRTPQATRDASDNSAQDARAFAITPPPQRTPPQPGARRAR